jgi:arylsulfatase A-like enzyme
MKSILQLLVAVVVLALTLPFARAQAPATATRRPPNIVFILADDLGYGDIGCYGQQKIQTPNIDHIAQSGIRFTQAYAGSPVCAPSRCSLLTGLHTGHARIRGNAKVDLRPDDLTVPELLQRAGYDTMAAGKWGLGAAGSPGAPTRKGFNAFFGFVDQTHAHNSYPSFLIRNDERVGLRNVVPNEGRFGQGVATVKADFANDLFNEDILAYLGRVPADRPFFLYAAFTAPHANDEADTCEVPDLGPYANVAWPEPEKRYAALVTRLDSYVGRILDALRQRRLENDTLVIFTSDNGTHTEGGNDPAFFNSSGPLRGIKRDLYEGGIRVPFVAAWPGHIAPGSTSDRPIAFYDFLPTTAELAGVPAPANLDGLSFVPALLGKPDAPGHEFLYWEFHERGFEQAVRMGDWKTVRHAPTQPFELYNLRTDPGERYNLAQLHPEIIRQITAYLSTARTDSPEFPIRTGQERRNAN